MINNSEVNKLLTEHRMAKSDFARLKSLTELQQIIEKEILEIARKMK